MPASKTFSHDEINGFKDKFKIPKDYTSIAIIARLTEVKGHDDILDAAKLLPENTLILAAGSGERLSHIEERITKENITNVRLLGFINEVDELIAATDIQINASFGTEATSMTLIQGMSAGKPAVVTNFGGNPYVIKNEENGLVVPTRNPTAMAEAITRLTNDKNLYGQLSKGAKKIYQENFTDKKMASQTEDVYIELMKGMK